MRKGGIRAAIHSHQHCFRFFHRLTAEGHDVIRSFGSLRRSPEDELRIVLHFFQPSFQVAGVILQLSLSGRQAEFGGDEAAAEFRHQFHECVAVLTF
jgi:hypothetical protein